MDTKPKAVIFLCLLLTLVVILVIVDFFFGKRLCPCFRKILKKFCRGCFWCCCCGRWGGKKRAAYDDYVDSSEYESTDSENDVDLKDEHGSIEMQQKKSIGDSVASTKNNDLRINVAEDDLLINSTTILQQETKANDPNQTNSEPFFIDYTACNESSSLKEDASSSDTNSSLPPSRKSTVTRQSSVPRRSASFKRSLFQKLSTTSRKTQSIYGSFESRRWNSLRNSKSYSVDSASTASIGSVEGDQNGCLVATSFPEIESISVQILITFDQSSEILSAGVKQFEVSRCEPTSNSSSVSNKPYHWQVVVEVLDQHFSDGVPSPSRNRIKTNYKTGDKITFQSHLDTQNTDSLDNLLVRYSVYARRGTRVSQKQLFGQTSVLLTLLKESGDNVLFEWRTITRHDSINYY